MDGHSTIVFHKFRNTTQPDENNLYAIVRWDTDKTVKIEKEAIHLIHLLVQGKTIEQAAKIVQVTTGTAENLLDKLQNAGFIKNVDNKIIIDTEKKIKPWFLNIDRKWFSWILSKPILYSLFLYILFGITIGFIQQKTLFTYRDFFWTEDAFIVLLSLFIFDFIFLFIHEFAHLFATKAVGGESEMRISNRYFFVVAETVSYHLAIIPKALRYFVYTSGMIADLAVIATLYWIIYITNVLQIQLGIIHNLFMAIILGQIIGIVWEYTVFLETDIYNFLSDFLNFENLIDDAKKFFILHLKRFIPKPLHFLIHKSLKVQQLEAVDDFRTFGKSEKRKLLLYYFIFMSGILFITFQFVFYIIPTDVTFISSAISDLIQAAAAADIVLIFRSILFLFLATFQYLILFFLRIKKTK